MLPRAFPSCLFMQSKAIMPPKASGGIAAGLHLRFFVPGKLFIHKYLSKQFQETPEPQDDVARPGRSLNPNSRQLRTDRKATIGVNVDLVLMYASVFEKNGRFIEVSQIISFTKTESSRKSRPLFRGCPGRMGICWI
jgi:hypothetical protein